MTGSVRVKSERCPQGQSDRTDHDASDSPLSPWESDLVDILIVIADADLIRRPPTCDGMERRFGSRRAAR